MSDTPIRPAFSSWPEINRRLRDTVTGLTPAQLALSAGGGQDRWPLWAVVGHLACQRVFWLCDFAGEPGAASTPFPDAAWNCPGDDDLEHVLSAADLVEALDASFAIVERCLDTWTMAMLDEVIDRSEWGDGRVHSRGFVIQRVLAHDVWHGAEVNEVLSAAGLPAFDPW
jgi:hypothetical protein